MESSEEKVSQMYRDFYFGNGKENPSVTTRLGLIESDVREVKGDVERHGRLLDGPLGLDRLIRDFLSEQKGRTDRDTIFRWAFGLGITALVGLLEWHPWR